MNPPSLWQDAFSPDQIPAYPGNRVVLALGGEVTWEIDPEVKIGVGVRPREARQGERIRTPDLKYLSEDRDNLLFRAEVLEKSRNSRPYQELQKALCKSSVLYFCNVFCWTFDPRLPNPHIPFVTFPFQDEFLTWMLGIILSKDDGLAEKSRDMGVTWCCAVVVAWLANFYPGTVAYLTSLREEDVDNKTEDSFLGKVRYIQRHLPEWMRNGWIEGGDGDVLMKTTIPATASVIRGQKTESTGGRQGRAKVLFADEFAHVSDGDSSLEAFASIADSRFYVSTPKGKGNSFARMAEDPRVKKKSMHWSLHPLKNAEWARKERAKPMYTDEIWAQEQEINYEKSTVGRIFPQFISVDDERVVWKHVHSGEEGPLFRYDPAFDVYSTSDFGFGDPTSTLFAQIRPALPEFSEYTRTMLLFFDEHEDREFGVWETRWLLNEKPYNYREHIGDMRTAEQRDSEGRTWMGRLQSQVDGPKFSSKLRRTLSPDEIGPPIFIVGKRNTEFAPIESMRTLMQTPGGLAISKEGCPHLIRALQNWSFPIDPKTRMPRAGSTPSHDRWSHACKAAVYLVDHHYAPKMQTRTPAGRPSQWGFKTQHGRIA